MISIPPNNDLKVLTFAGVFFPGYKGGGPIKTVKNLFDQAGHEISFKLVTSDRDLGDTAPYTSVASGEWNQVGKASVFYAQPGKQGALQIAKILREGNYDVIYLNSFFSPRFSFYPLLLAKVLGKKIVLSPRGEFSEGALSLKSLRKRIFIALYKLFGLHRGVVFQGSSDFEAQDICRALGPTVDVRVAENIGSLEFGVVAQQRLPGVLRAVFVSRISPMKNLLFALGTMRNVQQPVTYDIYGPIEDNNYWEQCLEIIETLPAHIRVKYKGVLNPAEVVKTMSQYDVFYMPSKGENYGHVIAEAICAGLPIVIADTTPWRNLHQRGLGWDLPLSNPDAFSTVLDELATMLADERLKMRRNILGWARNKFSQRDTLEANIALFKYAYEKK